MVAELTVLAGGKGKSRRASDGATSRPKAKTLEQAIADGDELAELKALKALLGKRIGDEKTSAVAVAALTKQLREIGRRIAELEGKGDEVTPVSEEGGGSDPIPDDEPWDDDI